MLNMKLHRVENIINVLGIIAMMFLDSWYPSIEKLINSDGFFTIMLKYLFLYFFLNFMGEIISIIYLYNKKYNLTLAIDNNIQGLMSLFILPVIYIMIIIVILGYIGIMYSLYLQVQKPYAVAIVTILLGFINGFQIGIEKYYEINNITYKRTIKINRRRKNIFIEEKPFDHSFNNMISISIIIFFLFYPINYFIEIFVGNIALTIFGLILLVPICYKAINLLYQKIFIKYELENENNFQVTILYIVYSIGCLIGFLYYDLSSISIIIGDTKFMDLTPSLKILLLIMTGYLPIRLIPIIFSINYKLHEKIINTLFVIIYIIKKFM
jgi:hypothetical protein